MRQTAEQTGKTMQEILERAVENYRRRQLLEDTSKAFLSLKQKVLPIAAQYKGIPLHVPLEPPEGGLQKTIYVKCEDICSISTTRLLKKLRAITPARLDLIEDSVRILLGL